MLSENRCTTCQHNICSSGPKHVAAPALQSMQYKVAAVPTHVAVLAVDSMQYKAVAVPTHVAIPTVHRVVAIPTGN